MTREIVEQHGQDPLNTNVPVALEIPSGDHPVDQPTQPAQPEPSINAGFDPQPLHENIGTEVN